jgi:signal transduction histidine kinase
MSSLTKQKKNPQEKGREREENSESRINDPQKTNNEIIRRKNLEKYAAIGRVSAMIAHEVKNRLTSINCATIQLAGELSLSPSNVFIDIINRNSHKINTLINNLVKVTSYPKLELSSVSINEVMDAILQEYQDRMAAKSIQVNKDYSRQMNSLALDKDKIKTAIQNIIINALEAMKPGKGILEISTVIEKNKCIITITDNGKGMDKETLSHLFEPYFTTKRGHDRGWGLAAAQNIIFSHGGGIEATSELNKGTQFMITLNR